MKKIISILLAIVMCFGMTTVAFAADETPEISTDSITSILLEAAKVASSLNDSTREALGEEIEKLLVEQIAGDNVILQQAAQWVLDKALALSGSDNILDVNKDQAETIAEFLSKVYDGNIADYIDNPLISFIVSFIPEEVFKEAVVWLLSDGLGDTLQDFINKYGDGEGTQTKPEEDKKEEGTILDTLGSTDWGVVLSAATKAISDFFSLLMETITSLFGGAQATPAA